MSRRLLCLAAAAAACLITAAPASAAHTPWRAIDGGALSAPPAALTDVAVGDDGTVAVVWRKDLDAVVAAVRAPGAATWDQKELAAPADSLVGTDPQAAVTRAGETVVVVGVGAGADVFTRPPGGDFGTPGPLAITGGGLDVAALSDGRVVAVGTASGTAITAAVRAADATTFGEPQTLSEATEGGLIGVSLATGADGSAAVAWRSTTEGVHRVRAAILRPDETTFPAAADADPGTSVAGFGPVGVSVGDDGAIDLAYQSLAQNAAVEGVPSTTSPDAIRTTHRGPGAADTWSTPDIQAITTTPATLPSRVSVVTAADGRGLVAYPDGTGLATLRRAAGATAFVPGQALFTPPEGSGVPAAPSFAALPDGRVATHWGDPVAGDDSLGVLGTDGTMAGTDAVGSADRPSALVANANGLAAIALQRSDTTIDVRLFDAIAPTLSSVSVPATATTGQAVAVSAVATERDSGPAAVQWSYGDGSAPTAAASHVFASAGSYTVRVTATDAAGNATSTERTIQVTAPKPTVTPPTTTTTTTKPGPEPEPERDPQPEPESRREASSPDRGAPVISDLMVLRKRFAVGARPTAMASARSNRAKRGTTLFFEVNERARVAVAVERSRQGWRSGGRCSPTRPKGARARRAKRCAAVQVLGVMQRQAAPGLNAVGFTGRLGRKALATGRYRFSVVATDAAGNASAPALAGFTVAR